MEASAPEAKRRREQLKLPVSLKPTQFESGNRKTWAIASICWASFWTQSMNCCIFLASPNVLQFSNVIQSHPAESVRAGRCKHQRSNPCRLQGYFVALPWWAVCKGAKLTIFHQHGKCKGAKERPVTQMRTSKNMSKNTSLSEPMHLLKLAQLRVFQPQCFQSNWTTLKWSVFW